MYLIKYMIDTYNISIIFNKVKAYSKITLNDLADKFANEGYKQPILDFCLLTTVRT